MHEDSTYMLMRGDLDRDDALAIGFYTVGVGYCDWADNLASSQLSGCERLSDRIFGTMFHCISLQAPVHAGCIGFVVWICFSLSMIGTFI
jgi:hypothetical protein